MFRFVLLHLFISIGLTVNAQSIDLHGTVTNKTGQPVADAIVTLVGQDLKDTTEADGTYLISTKTSSRIRLLVPQHDNVLLHNDGLEFNLPTPSRVMVQIFGVNGTLVKKEFLADVTAGFYRFTVAETMRASGLFIIKVTSGTTEMTFRYLLLENGRCTLNSTLRRSGLSVGSQRAATDVIHDTLKISAANYKEMVKAIDSYDQELDIILDSAVAGSTGSIGCGKELGDLKSGTYTISSASLSREYIIDIPANYDKDKPYRLIFGMHCMGSSMEGVVSEQYYGLKPLASQANIPCIFVAPQGYTDGSPWRVSDNKDHIFFNDLLTLLKEKLCVDTARVFCCGFSYGAMVSYSFSTEFQDQLRAVATYAPANWNIWLPTNSHKPIAYYQTTGTGDNLCSWVNSDAQKQGGKYCVLQHLEDNGCPTPANIPLATSGKHVKTEFSGCPEEYPVIFSSHNGGHQGTASDQGSNENWIAKETWELFMRF